MPDNLKKKEVWIIGAGPMAVNYAKVLQHFEITPTVIGRGEDSAQKFQQATGISVHTGGVDTFLNSKHPNSSTYIIIATGTEALMPTLLKFTELKFARILIEKPAAISIEELLASEQELKGIQEEVFIAYNRRFYPSVQKALEIIKEDGGLQSMHFEFTEWSHKIEPLQKAAGVKENWFFANSTHVVDLAFFIAGQPKDWKAYSRKGTLNWHDKSFFSGAGLTDKGVIFSYHSNWESAGRWSLELMTAKRKLLLRPMEELRLVKRGTIDEINISSSSEQNSAFKPGLPEQLKAFLMSSGDNQLCSLKTHIDVSSFVYKKIGG